MIVDDDHLAHDLATEAGRRLLDLRDRADFSDQAALRAAGDRLSHEYLTAALAAHRHGDALLSEEGKDDPVRLDEPAGSGSSIRSTVPASSARPAAPTGPSMSPCGNARPGAHAHAPRSSRRLAASWAARRLGAVRAAGPGPDLQHGGRLLRARAGSASGGSRRPASTARLRLVVSRTRPPEFVRRLAAEIGADLVPLGSAGAKIIAVVTGAVDAYVHAGGQYEWDSAAPVAVAQAAGLHASRIDGRPLAYNQPDPRLPDILVCRSAICRNCCWPRSDPRTVRTGQPHS